MQGAIIGDVIGSVYEWNNQKSTQIELYGRLSRFTDDTVLTIAVADCLLHQKDYATTIRQYGRRYPDAGYGGRFKNWLSSEQAVPYNSWGNGSAMRVSPIGFAINGLDNVLAEARKSAEVTHNHPEGIKGAQAVATAIYLARIGSPKVEIKGYIEHHFGYDLSRKLDEIRPIYTFDVSCQGSVPEAIIAFLESHDFEDAIRKAISIGGDSDTIACIAGGIAQAFYQEIPQRLIVETLARLPNKFVEILLAFEEKFMADISPILAVWKNKF